MAIGTSSLFKELLKEYEPDEKKRNMIIDAIIKYEGLVRERVPLNKINAANYNENLNNSLDFIENAKTIISWVNQIKIIILRHKSVVSKKIALSTSREIQRLERADFIVSISNKTEKEKQKKFFLEEALLEEQYELENIKIDIGTIDAFIAEAENEKELVFAYYQAIKHMQMQI